MIKVFLFILAQKYPDKTFLVPNLGIFIFLRKFAVRQIRGCWFQIDKIIFKFQHKYTQIRHFWSKNLRIFVFAPNFTTRQIRGCWFHIPALKYANLALLQIWQVPTLRIFIFCAKLCNKANSRPLISNMKMVSQNCYPEHPNKAFLVPNLRILILLRNFTIRQIGGRWLQIWQ